MKTSELHDARNSKTGLPKKVFMMFQMVRSVVLCGAACLLIAGSAAAQSLVPHFDTVFGSGATYFWSSGRYVIHPTIDMIDVTAVRKLSELMNSEVITGGTIVRLYKQDGNPLVGGEKDQEGRVTLNSLLPQAQSTGASIIPRAPATNVLGNDGATPALVAEFEMVFGEGSTGLLSDGGFDIRPTISMVDVVAVRELAKFMNSDVIPNEINVRLYSQAGGPLVSGTKDKTGKVALLSLLPQGPRTGAVLTNPIAAPAAPTTDTHETWGIECTTYEHGDTWGIRCHRW